VLAPADRVKDYKAAHPKFGMFGSIKTAEACAAERGDFHPYMFTWMIHIFPYEPDFKDVFLHERRCAPRALIRAN